MPDLILVVEDDATVAKQLARALEAKGYATETAADGEEGIEKYKALKPRLMIVEAMLPKLSGADICVHIRGIAGDMTTPVLLLGPNDSHTSLKQFAFGTGMFLAKPFKSGELWDAIDKLLAMGKEPDIEFDDVDPLESAALAATGTEAAFPPDGTIEGGRAFANLLLDIFKGGVTGILYLKKGAVEKRVFVLNGLPVNADSNLRSEEILSLLRERGRLSADLAMTIERDAQHSGRLVREVLVTSGVMPHRELYRWMRTQARERIVNSFGWDLATYRFERTKGFVNQIPIFELNPMALIDDGMERFYDPDDIMLEFYGARGHEVRVTERFSRYQALAQFLFPGLDLTETFAPGRTLDAILNSISMDPVSCQRHVKVFLETGLLEIVGARPAPATARVGGGVGDAAERKVVDVDSAADVGALAAQKAGAVDGSQTVEFSRGVSLLDQARFADAEAVFAKAVAVAPGEPLYRIYLGWTRFNVGGSTAEREKAVATLRRAVNELPGSDIGYQFLGLIAKRQGDGATAEAMFLKALKLNPQNRVALAELGFTPTT